MINQLKNNTKIKVISLLSAILLWLYVMIFVDPSENKLYENVPVTISNMSDLNNKDLAIYPEIELTTDIYISGKLSEIQKTKKENIHIYGEINDPIEGNNRVLLKANIDGNITHKFKDGNIAIINLEKVISEKKSIDIQLEGNSKEKIDKIIPNKDSIKITGPRVLVNQVQRVVAMLDVGNKVDDFTDKLKLYPINKNGDRVDGVDLESSFINVNVTLLREKNVPIRINYVDNENKQGILDNYKITPDNINIKGSKDIIDNISYIETKPLDIGDISNNAKEVALEIPKGVKSDIKYITIKLEEIKANREEIIYFANDIELRNKDDKLDTTGLNIPEEIKVSFEKNNISESIYKDDILLYIDLKEKSEDGNYEIKYETDKDINNIKIEPNNVKI